MKNTRQIWNALLFYMGTSAVAYGVYLIYAPAGIIVAGLLMAAEALTTNTKPTEPNGPAQ